MNKFLFGLVFVNLRWGYKRVSVGLCKDVIYNNIKSNNYS